MIEISTKQNAENLEWFFFLGKVESIAGSLDLIMVSQLMVLSPDLAQYMMTFQLERHTRSSFSRTDIRSPEAATLHMRRHLKHTTLLKQPKQHE